MPVFTSRIAHDAAVAFGVFEQRREYAHPFAFDQVAQRIGIDQRHIAKQHQGCVGLSHVRQGLLQGMAGTALLDL